MEDETLEVLEEGVPVLVNEGVDVVDDVAGVVTDQEVLGKKVKFNNPDARACFDHRLIRWTNS